MENKELKHAPGMFRFLDSLDRLRRSDLKLVQVFLDKGEQDEERYLVVDPKKEWDPIGLADKVLDYLDDRLSASLSNYP